MKRVILIDGKNFVFRHHFAHRGLATKDGDPTSVLYGCLSGLLTVTKMIPASAIAFVWDSSGTTWRHELLRKERQEFESAAKPIKAPLEKAPASDWLTQQISNSLKFLEPTGAAATAATKVREIPGYKADRVYNRPEKEIALLQIPELRRILTLLKIPQFRIKAMEADDLIGILATAIVEKDLFNEVVILSNDKDFYQLISDRIRLAASMQGNQVAWASSESVKGAYGVRAEDWVKYRALSGDRGDNIPPAIPGIGPKTALSLLHCGVDPSVKDYRDLPYNVRLKMGDMKIRGVGLVNWAKAWPEVVRNYALCKILRDGKSGYLKPETKEKLADLLNGLRWEDFMQEPLSPAARKEFSEWLLSKDMTTILARQEDFWELGRDLK